VCVYCRLEHYGVYNDLLVHLYVCVSVCVCLCVCIFWGGGSDERGGRGLYVFVRMSVFACVEGAGSWGV